MTINSKSGSQVTVGVPGDAVGGDPNFRQNLGDADRSGLAGHQATGGDLNGLTYEFVRVSPGRGDIVRVGQYEMPKEQAEKLGAIPAQQAQQAQLAQSSEAGKKKLTT